MDELVELLELLLVVDFLGVGRNSSQAIHDVVLHKHGGIAAHGKGNGVTGAGVDLALLAIGQHDDRRVEHRRLGANDLDALELGAQGVNGIEQQVMGNRALGAAAIDAAADGSSFKRTSLNGKGTQRRGRVRFAAALTKYDKRWHGTGGHDDGLYVDANHGTPPVRSG